MFVFLIQESSWHVKEKDKSLYFKSGIMDKIVYESSTPCTETDHYAVAVLQDKELHCTPIQGNKLMKISKNSIFILYLKCDFGLSSLCIFFC